MSQFNFHWFKVLPGSRRHPHGLEWRLLGLMPRISLIGTLLPAVAAGLARLLPLRDGVGASAATLQWVDIYATGAVSLHWAAVLTASIACFIVFVMKGPAYVADAYPVPDAEKPNRDSPRSLRTFSGPL